MNATQSISQTQRSSDTPKSAPASSSQASQADGRDFAATLSDAGPKPVRRQASHRQPQHSANGSHLPVSGNQPPPAIAPPPQATQPADAAQPKDVAGAAPTAPAGKTAPDPKAAAAPAAPAAAANAAAADSPVGPAAAQAAGDLQKADAGAQLPAGDPQASVSPQSAAAMAAPQDPAAASSEGALPAGPTMPHAASIRSLQTTGAATGGAASADPQVRAKVQDAANSDAAPAEISRTASVDANSAANDPSLNNTSTADAAAAAQAVMAAVAAPTPNAPAIDPSAADETLAPNGGFSLQGMAAANQLPSPAPAAGPHAPAAPSAIAAAAAAAVVQAVQGAADAGATDRHSHGNGQDSAAPTDATAGAAQLLTSNTPADAAPLPSFKIPAGVDTGDFGQGVADRVAMMVDGNLGVAKLQVNPPALGPIEVRIALQAGHAQVSFSSHSAVTRDALESSAPKLREMLGAQGFAQVSVDISQRSFQERTPLPRPYESGGPAGASPVKAAASTPAFRSANGLLDAYA